MRLTIKEYVDEILKTHKNISQVAIKIGASRMQLAYAIETNKMKFELKQKLVRLAVKCMSINNDMEQKDDA